MRDSNGYIELDLFHVLQILWHRVWIIVLVTILCGGLAFGYSAYLIEPVYDASALMYVDNTSVSIGSTSLSISPSDLSVAKSLVDTYVIILKTRTTLEEVIKVADLDYTYETLYNMVSASAVNSTEIFRITVRSTDPQEAADIANTITHVLPAKISDIMHGAAVKLVDFAPVPTAKAAPNIFKYVAVGAIIGILLSSSLIILADMLDDIIHGSDYLTSTYDIPVLAEIPDLKRADKASKYYSYSSYSK